MQMWFSFVTYFQKNNKQVQYSGWLRCFAIRNELWWTFHQCFKFYSVTSFYPQNTTTVFAKKYAQPAISMNIYYKMCVAQKWHWIQAKVFKSLSICTLKFYFPVICLFALLFFEDGCGAGLKSDCWKDCPTERAWWETYCTSQKIRWWEKHCPRQMQGVCVCVCVFIYYFFLIKFIQHEAKSRGM